MKIKAKNTNSASENAILYPVTQTDSLIAFNFVYEAKTQKTFSLIILLSIWASSFTSNQLPRVTR